MNKIELQTYPDGTLVRFTDDARRSMAGVVGRGGLRPLGPRRSDPHGVFTITNTDDNLHDVVLNESGERWGIYWLEEVEAQDQVDGDRA